MRASVLTPEIDITPGERATVRVEVTNTLDVVDLITVGVPGLPSSAVEVDRPTVSLFPGTDAVVTLTIVLPRTYPAGPGEIEVRVASAMRPEMLEFRTIRIDVAPLTAGELNVHPEVLTTGSKASLLAIVENTGNTALDVTMLARDDERYLRFLLRPPTTVLHPGGRAEITIEARGRRPFFGNPAYRSVYVSATSGAGVLDESVSLTQKPLIPRGAFTAAVLAAIIALWALIVTFGVQLVLSNEPAAKAAPADFRNPLSYATLASVGTAGASPGAGGAGGAAAGSASAKLAAILGSVSGTLVGADSGEPIPKVAVEAHRQRRDTPAASLGTEATRVQSASTDANGMFTLDGLFPGTYRLHLVGVGFEDVWYPAATSFADAADVTLTVGQDRVLDPVAIRGQPGTIVGTVDTGDLVVPVTVVVRPYVDEVPGGEVARTEAIAVDTDGDGLADEPASYTVTGLASPLDYHLTFSSDRFDDQVAIEQLDAEETLEAAPVRLAPAEGAVTGTVTLSGLTPSAGVRVVATEGASTFETETPVPGALAGTDQSSVTYSLDGLPTPATYTLTFSSAGFETVSTSVDLGAGDTSAVADATLAGDTTTLTGTVRDTNSSLVIGDVDITVIGPGTQVNAKTFPAPTTTPATVAGDCRSRDPVLADDIGPEAGTFLLQNLELGIHSITFSKPGWTSVTHRVEITDSAPPRVLTPIGSATPFVAELASTVGEVCGRVTNAADGEPITDGRVELRDGAAESDGAGDQPITSALATAPDAQRGAYKLAGLASGEYTLTVLAPGFQDCTVLFRVGEGARTARNRILNVGLVTIGASSTSSCSVTETPEGTP